MRKTLLLLALACSQLHTALAKTPEQALPLKTVLQAVRDKNVEAFKSAWSARIVQEDKARGSKWSKSMAEGRDNMTRMFGDYKMNQFDYTYEGTPQSGSVTCLFKGKKAFSLKVVHEKQGWKLDER